MPPSITPIPTRPNSRRRMFARWPGEFIRPVWATGMVGARARFSPAVVKRTFACMHAIEWRESLRRLVRKVTARKHISRMTSRNFRQSGSAASGRDPRLSLLVHQIQHLFFQIRTRTRLLDFERKRNAFV